MGRINFLWIIEDRISSCRESGVNMGLNQGGGLEYLRFFFWHKNMNIDLSGCLGGI